MLVFTKRTPMPCRAEALYAWHTAPDALAKLIPPWQKATVVSHEGIGEGRRAVIRLHLGPFRITWLARHGDVIPGRQFRDVQVAGPFKQWSHLHRMIPLHDSACILEDQITCEAPGGRFVDALARPLLQRMLERLFTYRHQVTLAAWSDVSPAATATPHPADGR